MDDTSRMGDAIDRLRAKATVVALSAPGAATSLRKDAVSQMSSAQERLSALEQGSLEPEHYKDALDEYGRLADPDFAPDEEMRLAEIERLKRAIEEAKVKTRNPFHDPV